MGLEQTVDQLKKYLEIISKDIDKAMKGNKAASQRVRTMTIRFEKTAKLYRKESIKWEKSGAAKALKTAKKSSVKKAAPKKKVVAKKRPVAKAAARKVAAKRKPARRR
jgi:hypothetical protein